MKLSQQQIKQIDNYLIKLKVKFVDVRLELIDHLASDFEQSDKQGLLEDYLKSKIKFIQDFVKQRQKTIHWSYQKQMWQRLFMFFYKPTYLPFTIIMGLGLYWLQKIQPNKTSIFVLIISLVILHFWSLVGSYGHYKTFKKLQIAQPLYAIMALPSLFLYTMGAAKPLLENPYFFIAFWFLAILFNVAGAIELYNKKNKILDYSNTMV